MATDKKANDQLVGSRLKRIRSELGLKQKEVASALGISWRQYQTCEVGQRAISKDILIKLNSVYGVSIEWIVTGQGFMNAIGVDRFSVLAKLLFAEIKKQDVQLSVAKYELLLDTAIEKLLADGEIAKAELQKYVELAGSVQKVDRKTY